ncbi:MAG TPA: choice-of-anchor Q domain-containing protein [Thermomicrobiaceae bacterium]|nr:choice-of-anchor Q domain-containing protein [Thermomicrobiaceae bacterium]
MLHHTRRQRPLVWTRRRLPEIALVLLLALAGLVALLVLGRPATVFAANTGCSQGALQTALNSQATITFASGCTINLTSAPLTINPGVSVTINGNGLVITGSQSFDLIDITDSSTSPSSLTLNSVKLINGMNGIYEMHPSPGFYVASIVMNSSAISAIGQDAIFAGSATVTGSTIASYGDFGIDVRTATVTHSLVSSDTQDNVADGINAAVSADVTGSAILGNGGHGIFSETATGSDDTINGNDIGIDATTVILLSSTVSGNTTGVLTASFSPTADILAGNSSRNCNFGSVVDGGYNLSTDATCGFSGTSKNGVSGLNLLSLGQYGGPTPTIALGAGSIAIDAIPLTNGQCDRGTTADQRGVARPQGDACDIGAFEAIQSPVITITSNPASPTGPNNWFNAAQLGANGTLPVTITATNGDGLAGLQCAVGPTFVRLVPQPGQTSFTTTQSLFSGTNAVTCTGTSSDPFGASQGGGADTFGGAGSGSTGTTGVGAQSQAAASFKVDTILPAVTITSPANNASYFAGQPAGDVSYSCSDAISNIASTDGCVGTVPNGTPIDTNTVGPHTLSVTATDQAGNTNTQSVSYSVGPLAPPTLQINGAAPITTSGFWYNATNSPSGITLTVGDSNSAVTGYSCNDNNSSLSLTAGGTSPLTATASLGDGIQTLSCTASVGTVTSDPAIITIQVDRTLPVVSCAVPNPTIWYGSNQTVSCTAGDTTSGLANPNLSSFSLVTNVSQGSASGSAQTPSQQICDVAGNCVTAGPYSFKIDRQPPVITLTSPVGGAIYSLDQDVDAAYFCSDGSGSGVATCVGTVPTGSLIDASSLGTHNFTVNASDNVGNLATTTISYTVAYHLASLPGSTQTVTQGYWALIRIAPEDAQGDDLAVRTLGANTVELDGPNNRVVPFAYSFEYGMFSGKAGYQIGINSRSLAIGTWTLKLTFGGNSHLIYQVTFRVT